MIIDTHSTLIANFMPILGLITQSQPIVVILAPLETWLLQSNVNMKIAMVFLLNMILSRDRYYAPQRS
jgi:hypothetical protein